MTKIPLTKRQKDEMNETYITQKTYWKPYNIKNP